MSIIKYDVEKCVTGVKRRDWSNINIAEIQKIWFKTFIKNNIILTNILLCQNSGCVCVCVCVIG